MDYKASNYQLRLRDKLLKIAKRTNSVNDWKNYGQCRNKASSVTRSTKRDYYYLAFEESRNNPKTIWKTIKTLTGTKKKVNEVRNLNNNCVVRNDSTEMANKFNLHFSTIANKLRSVFPNVVSDQFQKKS